MLFLLFFFVKQKTAYELRIGDWSSDVCSSALRKGGDRAPASLPSRLREGPGWVVSGAGVSAPSPAARLFDFGFLELDVLAHDRVIFAERQLFGQRARVFLGHIEKAGIGSADELDLDCGRLGHARALQLLCT